MEDSDGEDQPLPKFLQVHAEICSFCDPDDPKAETFKQMHDSCFERYLWLIEFRLDWCCKHGVLREYLDGMDFPY